MNRNLCLRDTVASSDKFAFYRSMKEMLQSWLFANGYFVVGSEKFNMYIVQCTRTHGYAVRCCITTCVHCTVQYTTGVKTVSRAHVV